jgi:hypothetical protein
LRGRDEYVMGIFNFVKCIIENDKVYCTDADGNIYVMSLPKEISVGDCPPDVIRELLAVGMS